MVAKQSNGVYKLQIHNLEISPFLGGASVDSLSLVPNYARWEALQKDTVKTPRMLLDLQTGPARIRGLNFFKALFKQEVAIENLDLEEPKLLMTVMRQDTTSQHKPMHQTAKGFLKGFRTDSIRVRNGGLRYREGAAQEQLIFLVERFDLDIHGFKLDSTSFHNSEKAYYASQYLLRANKAAYTFPDGTYRATLDSLNINTQEQTITGISLLLNPLRSNTELAKIKGKPVTSQTLKVAQLKMNKVNFSAHSQQNSFLVGAVWVREPEFSAFKDQTQQGPSEQKPLPHDMVQGIKTDFRIDTIEVQNGYVRYEELVPQASESGHITINGINATISNLTNIAGNISRKNPAVVQVSAKIMEQAPMQATIRLPLLDQNGYHTIEGSIGQCEPAVLNPILVPTSFVKIESGQISRGSFNATLNKTQAEGKMTVIYSNVEVEKVKKGTGGKQTLFTELISEIADITMIKDSNPMQGEQPRTGDITVTRNAEKSVFNYWKDCLASGFLSNLGLKQMAKK